MLLITFIKAMFNLIHLNKRLIIILLKWDALNLDHI